MIDNVGRYNAPVTRCVGGLGVNRPQSARCTQPIGSSTALTPDHPMLAVHIHGALLRLRPPAQTMVMFLSERIVLNPQCMKGLEDVLLFGFPWHYNNCLGSHERA